MACCGSCCGTAESPAADKLPLMCLVPRQDGGRSSEDAHGHSPHGFQSSKREPSASPRHRDGKKIPCGGINPDFEFLDEDYLKKYFKFPQRSLYMDPHRRPLISFPMTQEGRTQHFTMFMKEKINQQILDGLLDPSEAVAAQGCVFPYGEHLAKKKKAKKEEEEEVIYILQLPDWEVQCPVHNQTIHTPRFVWHSCKKKSSDPKSKDSDSSTLKKGGGFFCKPKPWLLTRHTNSDYLGQWI